MGTIFFPFLFEYLKTLFSQYTFAMHTIYSHFGDWLHIHTAALFFLIPFAYHLSHTCYYFSWFIIWRIIFTLTGVTKILYIVCCYSSHFPFPPSSPSSLFPCATSVLDTIYPLVPFYPPFIIFFFILPHSNERNHTVLKLVWLIYFTQCIFSRWPIFLQTSQMYHSSCQNNIHIYATIIFIYMLLWPLVCTKLQYDHLSSLGKIPSRRIARSYVSSNFNSLGNIHTEFHHSFTSWHSHQKCRKAPFQHSQPSMLLFEFLMAAIFSE